MDSTGDDKASSIVWTELSLWIGILVTVLFTSFGNAWLADEHGHIAVRSTAYHALLLVLTILPIILLSKKMAALVDHGIVTLGAPQALGGFLVAILVLSPEGLAAIKAALANKLQRAMNISLGSTLSTIGLTIPAVLGISLVTGKKVALGLELLDDLDGAEPGAGDEHRFGTVVVDFPGAPVGDVRS